MSVAEFREELVAFINGLGIPTYRYLPAVPDPPCVLLDYETGAAIAFAHGAYEFTWHAGLCYPAASTDDAQAYFDIHKDPSNTDGLYRALMDNEWTTAHYVTPQGAGEIQNLQVRNQELLIVDFTLEVVL